MLVRISLNILVVGWSLWSRGIEYNQLRSSREHIPSIAAKAMLRCIAGVCRRLGDAVENMFPDKIAQRRVEQDERKAGRPWLHVT